MNSGLSSKKTSLCKWPIPITEKLRNQFCWSKSFLGLVEMTSGPVSASFSLPKWQAVKMIFFAPWGSLDEVHLTTLIPLFTILFNGLAA